MDRQRDRKLECDMDMCRTDTVKTIIKGCHLNKKDIKIYAKVPSPE